MNTNTLGAEYLLNQIAFCKNELRITCNDGAVHINSNTMNFTYIGTFGQMVCRLITKKNVHDNPANKLVILHLFMDMYSNRNGGFTLIPY